MRKTCLCCNGNNAFYQNICMYHDLWERDCNYCKGIGETSLFKYLYWKYVIDRNSWLMVFEGLWHNFKYRKLHNLKKETK